MQMELLEFHNHAGVPCAPGSLITTDLETAYWLLVTGVAKFTFKPLANTSPSKEPLS